MTDKQNNPDPIAHAARLLREAAEELRQAHAYNCSEGWENETDAKEAYDEHIAAAQALEDWEQAVGAGGVQSLQPILKAARTPHLLAADHKGMRVDYMGLLGQCRRALQSREPANAEMLRQFQGHLQELGRRWYAGDTVAVDEFLQLYCIEREARAALAAQGGQ